MLQKIYHRLFRQQSLTIVKRSFSPPYLLSEEAHREYTKFGYTVLRNCIPEAFIRDMLDLYHTVCQMDGIPKNRQFYTTGNLASPEIRGLVQERIKTWTSPVLSRIANPDTCNLDTGGALLIKPPSEESVLGAHQDNPIVDETQEYASYVWIPLCDMTKENGTLQVLPGSHLWGNHQRSRTIPWIFGRVTRLIEKNFVPVYVNTGDAIVFDSATIHGSMVNRSKLDRLAVSVAILPLHHRVSHYHQDADTPWGKVEKYFVDEDFFIRQDVLKRPSSDYPLEELENWKGKYPFSRSSILEAIRKFQPEKVEP